MSNPAPTGRRPLSPAKPTEDPVSYDAVITATGEEVGAILGALRTAAARSELPRAIVERLTAKIEDARAWAATRTEQDANKRRRREEARARKAEISEANAQLWLDKPDFVSIRKDAKPFAGRRLRVSDWTVRDENGAPHSVTVYAPDSGYQSDRRVYYPHEVKRSRGT